MGNLFAGTRITLRSPKYPRTRESERITSETIDLLDTYLQRHQPNALACPCGSAKEWGLCHGAG